MKTFKLKKGFDIFFIPTGVVIPTMTFVSRLSGVDRDRICPISAADLKWYLSFINVAANHDCTEI